MGQWRGRKFEDVRTHADRLDAPLRWRKPRRVFVNSMSDLFHEDVPATFIAAVFGVMAAAPQHKFQILTKRPERARDWFRLMASSEPSSAGATLPQERLSDAAHDIMGGRAPAMRVVFKAPWPLPNVWLGVSCEDQQRADERIPILLDTPAAVRFVSAEPLLGPIDLTPWVHAFAGPDEPGHGACCKYPRGPLHWIICGGESGPGARPCDVAWLRDIVRQCREAETACFVKQLGARPLEPDIGPGNSASNCQRQLQLRDRKGGDPAEWPEDLRVREFPA